MPTSKYSDFTFNEKEWVVSLITTGKGIQGVFGGHAKIIVEGVEKIGDGPLDTKLFIAEYHIMEAERIHEETWIPQALRNTTCKYLVLFKEEDEYTETEQKYSQVSARSVGGLAPAEVKKMIRAIKLEKETIDSGLSAPDFQYAGKWCCYSQSGGHNCTTWAEEQLDIIGIGKHLLTDSSKASPFLHANSSKCVIS